MNPSDWVVESVRVLNSVESWTGRIHIHKLLFLASELKGVDVPFEFELYQYGPYSFGLDSTIRDLTSIGLLNASFPSESYGAKYAVAPEFSGSDTSIPAEAEGALAAVAREIGPKKSGEVELIATCAWVASRELVGDQQELLARVKQIKPRYSAEEIRAQFEEFQRLQSALGTSHA